VERLYQVRILRLIRTFAQTKNVIGTRQHLSILTMHVIVMFVAAQQFIQNKPYKSPFLQKRAFACIQVETLNFFNWTESETNFQLPSPQKYDRLILMR